MSVNKYTTANGLQTLANGSRVWIGTKQSYEAAKQAGTLPTDCLICITDDDDEFKTNQVIKDSQMVITSGGVYDALEWTLIGTGTGESRYVNITDEMLNKYKEFYIYFDPKNVTGVVSKDTFLYITSILKTSTTNIITRRTYYETASARISIFISYDIINKRFSGYYNLNGTDVISGYEMKVYAR